MPRAAVTDISGSPPTTPLGDLLRSPRRGISPNPGPPPSPSRAGDGPSLRALSVPDLTLVCAWKCAEAGLRVTSLRPGERGCKRTAALTQIAIHNFAVVHLSSHGADFLQLILLGFHALLQFLELLIFRNRLLLMALLLLQEM